ncbi:unnamed protein product [Tuber aestivum]|uniref:Zn(2)-C6 fungal-type domain-containing protein n=1 Tax=Tuber aestivum TaxID=59557 RepID=A0A292PYT1_9PEZI|nr:unnamed protein product [Tuber aestivum]
MSETSGRNPHPYSPAAHIPQRPLPDGNGVHPASHESIAASYNHPNDPSLSQAHGSMGGGVIGGHNPGEQHYHYSDAPSSTPRTAYPNGSLAQKWPPYFQAQYSSPTGDHDQPRHLHDVSPLNAQFPPQQAQHALESPRPIVSRQHSTSSHDPSFAHPHHMTHPPPYSMTPPSYTRPPHNPVEPNAAAPSPPNQYPSSPRTPQVSQLPATNGLPAPLGTRNPSSARVVPSMPAPVMNGHRQHHEPPLNDLRREYHQPQHSGNIHLSSDRVMFAEPDHHDSSARYSPLGSSVAARRPSGLDIRPDSRDRVANPYGPLTPVNSQNPFYSSSSPLSPASKVAPVRGDGGGVGAGGHFPRYQFPPGGDGYRYPDSHNSGRHHSEDHGYPITPSQLGAQKCGLPMEPRRQSPRRNSNMLNGHSHGRLNGRDSVTDDTDDEEIKMEAMSRTPSIGPTAARNVIQRVRRDSMDSVGSTESAKDGGKKRGGAVFTDSNGRQHYEEDVLPLGVEGEIPPGWQMGTGKKCLRKLLPVMKDGLPVFPEWGLTSAGKARQRLPKACASCRTKKIKCVESEQDETKCQHCVKMKIPCSQDQREEEPSRKISKKLSGGKKKKKESDHDNIPGSSASPGIIPPNGVGSGPMASRKRKPSEDSRGGSIVPKRGKPSRGGSFPTEPLGLKTSGLDRFAENPVMHPRHSQPRPQTTPVQGEQKLMFATPDAGVVPSNDIEDDSIPPEMSRRHHAKQLLEQYSAYGSLGGRVGVGTETPPHSYASASPSTSVSNAGPETAPYGTGVGTYGNNMKGMSSTPTIADTPPLSSIPRSMSEDPRHSLLPNREVMDHLVKIYFTYVYSQTYAFLHRKTFEENMDKHLPVLLFSLCAVSARFSPLYSKDEETYADLARREILKNYDNNHIEVVQSMIHMGLHDFGTNNGHKAWMFAGMAVRMGAALNLNLENGKAKGAQTTIAREVARRTYWSYYLMDRLNSYGVARPFLTQDHDCHVQLPCNQPSFNEGKSVITEHLLGPNPIHPGSGTAYMGAMAFLVRAVGIWGNILKQIHMSAFGLNRDRDAEFRQLIESLETWRKKLPTGLQYSNENLAGQIEVGTAGAFVMMHVMWHTAMAYVHRYVRSMGDVADQAGEVGPDNQVIQSIRKTFVHADAVLLIMSHVHERKLETQLKDRSLVVNAPFLGQAISDACEISMIRARELKGEHGGAGAQKQRVFTGLGWLKELRRYWKPMEGIYKKLRKSCKVLEGKLSQPPSNRLRSDMIPSPDSGTGSQELNNISSFPMFHFPVDAGMYDLQPHSDAINQPLQPITSQQALPFPSYTVPEHYYEAAFADHSMSLYNIAQEEGAFPNLYLPHTGVDMGASVDSMPTTLAPSGGYGMGLTDRGMLGSSSVPLVGLQGGYEHMDVEPDAAVEDHDRDHELDNSEPEDDDEDTEAEEDGKARDTGSPASSKRKGAQPPSISTLYFHPTAVQCGQLSDASGSEGSEGSGPGSRRPSEVAPVKPETNRMDLLHLLGASDDVTQVVSRAVAKQTGADLGTGRAGIIVPDDGTLTGEINVDNSNEGRG